MIPVTGSDAHAPFVVGSTAIKTKDPITKDNFLDQLREGEIILKENKLREQKGGAYFRSLLIRLIKDSRIYRSKKARMFFSKVFFRNVLRVKNFISREVKPRYEEININKA